MYAVIVKESLISGKGVFANKDFKKNEIVIDWKECSRILTKEEFDKLSDAQKKYVSIFKNKYILFKSPAKYVNHSCNPNTSFKNNCDVAIKAIKKGEEITGNYILEKANINFKCNCGSKNCVSLKSLKNKKE